MELELGLKITKTIDDISSIFEYQLAKDKGPEFQSRETNTTFILTAHLKGYKRNNIDIKISKDGSKITISGEKPIQEMVMIGWAMHKKVVDVTRFNKVFKIPNGVNLDRIKAKYDEDEWILSIVMPKLVKGICGQRIEEVKEEEFDKRKLEREKSEIDHVSSSVGETSQRGSKDNVQDMESSENIMQKMVDDANKEINEERIKKEAGESNLGNGDGHGDGNGEGVREKVGKEKYAEMKTSELEKNDSVEQKKGRLYDKMLDDANEDITGGTVENGKEESMLRIEDDKLKGNDAVEEEKMVFVSMLDDANEKIIGEMIQKEEDESVKEKVAKEGCEECLTQQSGESKQKTFGESKCETEDRLKENMKENSMEPVEAMNVSEVDDQNVDDSIPRNISDIRQKELEESTRIQQKEKTKSTKGKNDGGQHEKKPNEANKDVEKTILGDIIQKDNIKPKTEIDNENQECVRKMPGKEGFVAMVGIREQFPKHFPKTTLEESEKRKNGIEESGQHVWENAVKGRFELPNTITEDLPKELVELDGSKGFKVENVVVQEDMIKEEKAETESLMDKEEGEESEKRNEEANKVFDDTNKKMNEERIKKEVGESKMEIGGGNGKGMRKKVGKEVYEVMKSSEQEKNVGVGSISERIKDTRSQDKDTEVQKMERSVEKKEGRVSDKMLHDGNRDKTGSTIKKGREESKLRNIEDEKVKGVREKIGNEAMKTSEIEQDVGAGFPQNIRDICQDKEFEDEEMKEKGSVVEKEKTESGNMFYDTNEDITEEIEKSKFGIEERGGNSVKEKIGKEGCEAMKSSEQDQNLGACTTPIIGLTSEGVSEDSLVQESGNSKQKEFGESKCETEDGLEENMKASNMEPFEAMKVSKLDDPNVVDHIPSTISDISQKELEETRIQQMEKSKRTKGKIDGGQYGLTPVEGNKDVEKTIFGGIIQKDIIKPQIEFENEGQECVREEGKEGSDVMAAIKEDFPKYLPKTTLQESEELNVQKMKEIKDVNEEIFKRKGKEKGEGERHKTMHVDANRGITRDTVEEETEKRNNGIEESDQQHVRENTVKGRFELRKGITEELPKELVELDGSNEFKVANEEKQEEVIKEEKAEAKSLMENEEGEESKKANEEAEKVLDDAYKETNDERLKRVGESKMGIGDGNGKGVRKKVGKEEHEVEKNVGVCIPQRIEDTTSKDKESDVQKTNSISVEKKEGRITDKMLDDGNGDQTGSTIKKGREESKLRIEDGNVNGMKEKIGKVTYEAMKTSEIEQDVGAGFPQNIGDISQDKEFEDQQMKEKGSDVEKEKMESDNMLHNTNEEITGEIKKSMFGIEEGGEKSVKEKVGNEGCEEMKSSEYEEGVCEEMKSSEYEEGVFEVTKSITEGLPKQLEELDGSKELKVAEEEELKEVTKEANAETEILMEKMEDSKKRNEEASRYTEKSTVIETLLKKTEESNIEKKSSDGPIVQEKLPEQVVEAISQDEKNKIEHGIVKLKGKGSIKMHVENDTTKNRIEKEITKQKLESGDQLNLKENVDNGIFDGRKRQKFLGMEEVEDAKEDGAKNEGCVKKVTGDKYEKIHVETNEDLKKDITKETRGEEIKDPKGEHLHEEMSKERSQQSKAAKELNIREKFPRHLPKTTLEESEELSVQNMQEIKDVREEMIKRKGKDTEHFMEKGEGERHKTMHVDATKCITRETIEDDMAKRKNGVDDSGQQHIEKDTVKGRFELPKSITEELPKKLVELDGRKGFKVAEEEEQQEVIKAEKDKTECFMEKEEGKESKKINEVADKVLDDANKEIRKKRIKKEVGESKKGIGDGNGKGVRKKVGMEEDEVMMETLEQEKIVSVCIPLRIEDTTSKDKKSEVQEMDSRSVEKKDGKEEIPKHLRKTTLEESEELNVQTMQEIKDVKEEMIKRKGKEIEYSEEKGEGERHKTRHVEENKGMTRETMQEKTEKKKNGVDENGQQDVGENTVKGVFEVPTSITEVQPKQLEEFDGSKELKVAKEEEQKEATKEAMAETDILIEKVEESKNRNEEASRAAEKSTIIETLLKKTESNIEKKSSDGPLVQENLPKQMVQAIAHDEKDKTEHGIVKLKEKGSEKMHVEPNEASENDTTGNRIEKEIRKQKLECSDQLSVKENVNNEIFDGRKRQNFPEMEEVEDAKQDGAKIEQSVKKVNGDKYEKIQVEANEDFKKDITKETKGQEIVDPKIETKKKGEHHLHEVVSKDISQESKPAKEDFTLKVLDSPTDTREGLKEAKMEKIEGIKEEDAENEQFVNKVKGEKYEKIQVGARGGLRNDTIKDTIQKEKEEPGILFKVKDQQSFQDDIKGRYEASTTAREFSNQIVDSLAKTREKQTHVEIVTEETKGELSKKKSGEKKIESTTKAKFQGSESGKITQILHEAPEEKHPKALEIGTPEKELPSERGHTTCAKDKKQKTNLLPLKFPSKETRESKDEGMNQNILKPEKSKEVGEQCTYSTAGRKEVATIEDQVTKPLSPPRFPSTHQSEVEEKDKFYEGGKAKYEAFRESQKEDPTKDMQNLIEMKGNQEAKLKEVLKSEAPPEQQIKKGGHVIRRGKFHKWQNVGEKMQEKTEGPKKKIDDRNQQYVAIDVGKVETIEEEMFKECEADAGSIAERVETKKGLKTTLEREDYMTTQNVNDEKPKIQDEIIKAEIEKVNKEKCILESMKTAQEKDQPIKSEDVEKETESLEAISSLPSVTSMGVKEESPNNETEDLHQKELSPLKVEMKSKEPLELEKPVIQWKLPKTKEHVPLTELRDKEQHSYLTCEIQERKITPYEGAKPSKFQRQIITQQSTDEENRKSENDVEEYEASKESPKINIGKTEQIDSFQPQVLGNEYYEEHKFDEQVGALDQCEFQGQKILNGDRVQQHVQDNNDNKGSQTSKDVKEEMFMKEREGSKVAKSGEAKNSSRNKRERGKTTHSPEEKKPKMKEKTSYFEKASGSKQVEDKMHETGDTEHQIDSEEVTSNSKVKVEPPIMIENAPKKEVERKEPHEITWPNMDYETPQISDVEEEKEGERPVHALEAKISEEELAQATATHSKTVEPKGENEIDKPQVNQLPSPSKEMLSKEPQESEECSMKECDSKGENIVQVSEKKDPSHSTEGTTASEEVSVKEESQEAKKKDSKTDVQLPNKGKRDQQCINKDEEEKYGINEIEEEKASEEGLEEHKEYKEEASGGKKDDTTMPKKLFVPLVIAGSVLLGGIFVWQRRTRKR